jgi:hypothetical protein
VTTPSVDLIALLERYSEQRDAYLVPAYDETQVRRELLDPFFSALGWDIANRQGYAEAYAEAYKDVTHEDQVRVEGSTKAPDYSFRVGGTRKFFVEAKKPSVDVEHDPAPALQLRRYGWSAGLPLSVLMNFEHLAVYEYEGPQEQWRSDLDARIASGDVKLPEWFPQIRFGSWDCTPASGLLTPARPGR